MIRLWSKCRRPRLDPWKAAHDRPYYACGKHRRASDVVWRAAARAEASRQDGGAAATQLWDMKKYYESFNLRLLYNRQGSGHTSGHMEAGDQPL